MLGLSILIFQCHLHLVPFLFILMLDQTIIPDHLLWNRVLENYLHPKPLVLEEEPQSAVKNNFNDTISLLQEDWEYIHLAKMKSVSQVLVLIQEIDSTLSVETLLVRITIS